MKEFNLRTGKLSRAFLLTLSLFLIITGSLPASASGVDRIVAIVGEDIILASELENAEAEISRQLQAQGNPAVSPKDLRKQVLERLILTRLQTQRARERGINVTNEDIDEAMKMIASRNNLSLSEFRIALANEGMNYEFYRQQLTDEILINRIRQQEVDSRVTVTDRDVDLFLQAQSKESGLQYRLRQILVAVSPESDRNTRDAAKLKAETILRELQQGADFATVAQSQSDGQQALEGGDLGWIDGHLLPTAFADSVPALNPGEISEILSSDSGLHIVKLEETRAAGKRLIQREVRARHILLRPNEIRNPAETEALIRDIHRRLTEGGEEFSKLAREFSNDPGSASEGGELGWQDPRGFDPDFSAALENLEPGVTSEPFRSAFGWHIAEVLEWRERDMTDLQRRATARNILKQRRTSEEYDRWLRRLRGDAYVEYRIEGMEKNNLSQGN